MEEPQLMLLAMSSVPKTNLLVGTRNPEGELPIHTFLSRFVVACSLRISCNKVLYCTMWY